MNNTLCLTVGDPAGIGPFVTEHALQRAFLHAGLDASRVIVVGPRGIADVMAQRLSVRAETVAAFAGPLGCASAASGRAALATLMRGIELAQCGEAAALVTAPISKEALAMAGSQDRGHTEILARHLGDGGPSAMAFFSPRLATVLVTAHVPLARIWDGLNAGRVAECAGLLHRALQRRLGKNDVRLALAGLNPHAGEAGLLGDEELTLLAPAIELAKRTYGFTLAGPYPPDTVFRRAVDGEFDGVVSLYHDQGLIAVKLLAFGEAVNVTLGLKVVRTSPDHGTAFDLVRRAVEHGGEIAAKSDGMFAAICEAARMVSMGT